MSLDDFNFKNSGISIDKDQKNNSYAGKKNVQSRPIGITTPLKKGYRNNESLFQMHFDLFSQIDDNLKNLLMTKKGERLGLTSFGTNLNKIFNLTNLNKDEIEQVAMDEIRSSVSQYMPFVSLLEFSSKKKEDMSNKKETVYELIITYTIPNLNRNKKRSLTLNLRTSN